MIRTARMILALVVFTLCSAIASYAADKGPVVLALQAPITGPWAYEGQMIRQSAETMVKLLNDAGGVDGGRKLELRVVDTMGQPREAALGATKLASQKDVFAVIGSYASSITEATSSIFEKKKILDVTYSSTAVHLTDRGFKYFFRTCGIDSSQGKFFADYATGVMGAKRIAIIHDNTAFAAGVAEETEKALTPIVEEGKAEIVYYDAITPGEKDFTVTLTKIREAKPDVIYFTGYFPEAALMVTQAREIGLDCPFVGANGAINNEFIKIAGIEMAEGCMMTQEPMPADLPYEKSKSFLEAYRSAYGDIPSSPWPIYAAEAVNVLAYAVDKTGSTDATVLAEYLRNDINGLEGITGPVGFTEKGDREGVPYQMYVVNAEGKFEVYKPD